MREAGWVGAVVLVVGLAGCRGGVASPLERAAANGDFAEIARLVDAGEDPNGAGDGASTPLVAAARAGQVEALRALLARGADPALPAGVNGWSPLEHAIHKGQNGTALLLLAAHRPGHSVLDRALMMAAGYGNAELVRALVARGADPRTADAGGYSALTNAVGGAWDVDYRFSGCAGHTATVRALLDAAPDLRIEDGLWARRAVRQAERRGCTELVALVARPRA